MKKYILITLLCMCCNLPVLAFAATTTGQVNVTTTLFTASASLSVSTYMSFGTFVPTTALKTAAITISSTVTSGVPYTIKINNGSYTSVTTGNIRRMRNAQTGTLINYQLFQDAAHMSNWNINQSVASVGTGVNQSTLVYGSTNVLASYAPGNYSDSLLVTLTY